MIMGKVSSLNAQPDSGLLSVQFNYGAGGRPLGAARRLVAASGVLRMKVL